MKKIIKILLLALLFVVIAALLYKFFNKNKTNLSSNNKLKTEEKTKSSSNKLKTEEKTKSSSNKSNSSQDEFNKINEELEENSIKEDSSSNESSGNSSENKEETVNMEGRDTSTTENEVETHDYTFTNEFGTGEDKVTIKAIKYVRLGGFAGASSNIYYIDKNYVLYHLELVNLKKTILSNNIVDIKLEDNGKVIAYYNESHTIKNDNMHITYEKSN